MRMSFFAYLTLALGAISVLLGFAITRDPMFLVKTVPMLAALYLIPWFMTESHRRSLERIDTSDVRKARITGLQRISVGEAVKIRGEVAKASFKWLNRPHFVVTDGKESVKVIMFTSPREDIREGDKVEAAGTLRFMGLTKEKKIWGVSVKKIV